MVNAPMSEHSHRTAEAISSGLPMRPTGSWLMTRSRPSGVPPVVAVPPQDRGRGDEAMTTQRCGVASDQRGEQGSVGPVHSRSRVGSTEYRDLVAQDEQLDVLGRRCTAEQRQPVEEPDEDR
jgi:hypothetical protein